MKINDLSKELKVTNKELIDYLKSNGFKVSSHLQNATDEMIELAKANVKPTKKETVVKEKKVVKKTSSTETKTVVEPEREAKKFAMDDIIMCRSVCPGKLLAVGVDKNTVYHWNNFGDVDYLSYRDLQALRRTEYITKPLIIIEDEDLCYQWRRELGDTYKYFFGVEYPEEFFDKSDDEFEELLTKAPKVMQDVIKTTAMSMVRAENYPTIQKLTLIDNILGTCIKEFI